MLDGLSQFTIVAGNAISIGVVVGIMAHILPSVAVVLTIIQTAIRIGEWVWEKWKEFRNQGLSKGGGNIPERSNSILGRKWK